MKEAKFINCVVDAHFNGTPDQLLWEIQKLNINWVEIEMSGGVKGLAI